MKTGNWKTACRCLFAIGWACLSVEGIRGQSLDVTSTGINSTTIGATTPAAGTFTTLEASGTIAAGTYGLRAIGASGANRDIFIAGAAGLSNGFTVQRVSSNMVYTFGQASGNVAVINSTGLTLTGKISVTGSATNLFVADASNGMVYVGTAGVVPSTTTSGVRLADPFHVASCLFSAGPVTTNLTLIEFMNGNGVVGSIVTGGGTTAFNTVSDRRLKTNLRDISDSGEIVDALRPRLFDWRSGGRDNYGFVAQELYAAFPQAVTKGDDDPETISQQWQIDASKLVPVLAAEIKSLRARMKAFEARPIADQGEAIQKLVREMASLREENAELRQMISKNQLKVANREP